MAKFKNKCCQYLASELHYSKFCLCYRDWRAFTYSPWLPPRLQVQWIILAYRWIMALYFIAWLFPSGLCECNGGPKFFIYLTNWGELAWSAYLLVAALANTFKFFQVLCFEKSAPRNYDNIDSECALIDIPKGCCGKETDGIAWYHKIQWLLFDIAAEAEVSIVILYWSLFYRPDDPTVQDIDGVNINTHLTPGIVALFDLWFSGTPVRLLHFIYLQLFGATFAVFSGFYYAANGTNALGEPYIYDTLDYEENPGSAVGTLFGVVFVFFPVIHLLFWLQYLARSGLIRFIYRHCIHDPMYSHTEKEDTIDTQELEERD